MDLDLNSGTLTRQMAGKPLIDALDRAILAKQAAQTPRQYLGGSYVGGDCERQIQYQYTLAPVDDGKGFPADILRVFERGHRTEDMAAQWIRDAGLILKTETQEGRQFGFSSAQGRFKGHADGVIVGWTGEGESPVAFPALWENKAVNSKTWQKIRDHGVKKVKPVYYGQVALYQYHLQLMDNPAVFTFINADTMQVGAELIPFDALECQRLIDRAVRIIQATDAREQLPRVAAEPDHFACRFCSFAARCWSAP
jgi:hypothetical protein